MVSKPKPCKYGCGTIITWNETQRFFQGPDNQKHDCRDWPGVGQNGGGAQAIGGPAYSQGTATAAPLNTSQQGYPINANQQETLIGVQAKKTWENYFKMLEPLTANSAAFVSQQEETNKILYELIKQVKSLEESLAVLSIKAQTKEVAPEVDT